MTAGLVIGAAAASKGARVLDEDLGWFHYEPEDDDDDDGDGDKDKDDDHGGNTGLSLADVSENDDGPSADRSSGGQTLNVAGDEDRLAAPARAAKVHAPPPGASSGAAPDTLPYGVYACGCDGRTC